MFHGEIYYGRIVKTMLGKLKYHFKNNCCFYKKLVYNKLKLKQYTNLIEEFIMKAKTTKHITKQQLLDLLLNIKKSTVISMTYLVDDSRSKTIKGEKQIQKLVKCSHAYLNHAYERKVQKLSGDNTFQALELKGKTRISSTIIQSDKTGEYLLDYKTLQATPTKIIELYHNGKVITEQEVIDKDLWANSYYNPSEKITAGRGLVDKDKDFNMMTLALKNILTLKYQGVEYHIV